VTICSEKIADSLGIMKDMVTITRTHANRTGFQKINFFAV
jgi:hypothetical protein